LKEFSLNFDWLEVYLRIGAAREARPLKFERYRIAEREHTTELRRKLERELAQSLKGGHG
jgi:hypothetical protein